MSLFHIKKRKEKEFMKYENGRVIPVKIEEHKNYKEFMIRPYIEQPEEINLKKMISDKVNVQDKVKKYGTFKTLKIVGAIAIIIFFGFTVKDVYLAFNQSDKQTETQPVSNNHEQSIDNTNDISQTSITETGLYQPGTENIEQIPPLSSKQNEEEQTTGNEENKSPLKRAIDASNTVNTMIVTETNKDLVNLNQYLDNKLNKSTFEKRLNESIQTKSQLLAYISDYSNTFKKEHGLPFYSITEERLTNSLHFTESILSSFNKLIPNQELIDLANEFIEKENALKESQNQEFLQFLHKNKIEYTINEEKGEINYTLK